MLPDATLTFTTTTDQGDPSRLRAHRGLCATGGYGGARRVTQVNRRNPKESSFLPPTHQISLNSNRDFRSERQWNFRASFWDGKEKVELHHSLAAVGDFLSISFTAGDSSLRPRFQLNAKQLFQGHKKLSKSAGARRWVRRQAWPCGVSR